MLELERQLMELFNSENAIVFIVDEDHKTLKRYFESQGWKEYDISTGIIGNIIKERRTKSVTDCYNDINYNNLVDLNTTLPIICTPCHHPITNKIVLGFEVINRKGIIGRSSLNKASIDTVDEEIIEYYKKFAVQEFLILNKVFLFE